MLISKVKSKKRNYQSCSKWNNEAGRKNPCMQFAFWGRGFLIKWRGAMILIRAKVLHHQSNFDYQLEPLLVRAWLTAARHHSSFASTLCKVVKYLPTRGLRWGESKNYRIRWAFLGLQGLLGKLWFVRVKNLDQLIKSHSHIFGTIKSCCSFLCTPILKVAKYILCCLICLINLIHQNLLAPSRILLIWVKSLHSAPKTHYRAKMQIILICYCYQSKIQNLNIK